MNYNDFLETKRIKTIDTGFIQSDINFKLFPFQQDICKWALKKGKSAIFADCGLGKTPMQLEWASRVCEYANGNVLILAPLAVSQQTLREGVKFGIDVNVCRNQSGVKSGINITNYEMLPHFEPDNFVGIVLDESSIIKAYNGKTRTEIIDAFKYTPYKLACTATPSPNDYMELGNHSEFLGVMTRSEMLSMFFVHDGGDTSKWRLKGHAEDKFWEWVASWSVVIRKPSDLGYNDNGFMLPKLNIIEDIVATGNIAGETLFPVEALTLQERQYARRLSITGRVTRCAELVNSSDEQWLVWCGLNSESEALARVIPDAVEVKGADTKEHKEKSIIGFVNGDVRVIVSKVSIFGFGMNLQNCHNVAFVGLSDSYEQFYQAIRRCWRFGQASPVNIHIISADTEGAVVANIKKKEIDAEHMFNEMVKHTQKITSESIRGTKRDSTEYKSNMKMITPEWLGVV